MGLIPRLHNNDSDDNDDLFHPGDIVVHTHYMDQHTPTYIFILPYKCNCRYTIHNGIIVEGMDWCIVVDFVCTFLSAVFFRFFFLLVFKVILIIFFYVIVIHNLNHNIYWQRKKTTKSVVFRVGKFPCTFWYMHLLRILFFFSFFSLSHPLFLLLLCIKNMTEDNVCIYACKKRSVCLFVMSLCMFLSASLFMCLFVSLFVCINVRMYVCMSLRMHQLYRLVVTRYYPSFLLFIPFERHAIALCTTYL